MTKIKSFENTSHSELCEEINKFSSENDVIATQTHFALDRWVAFVYYKEK